MENKKQEFLPISKEEMNQRGWEQADFVLVTGDAYVDHPSFGAAIIGRWLEANGYKVVVLSQPNWKNTDDFKRFGKPKLGFLITSGNVDSMVNHFSVSKVRRKKDHYSPGSTPNRRPDRSVIVYSNRAREAYKECAIVVGGLEASLRRFAHYDYWEDRIRKSILLDAKADILVYGMGEKPILEVAEALESGIEGKHIGWIKGTVTKKTSREDIEMEKDSNWIFLPQYSQIQNSKEKYAKSFLVQHKNNDFISGKTLVEEYDNSVFVIQNPPPEPLNPEELDRIYNLPYTREYHPTYESQGGIPALEEVKFSITANRGCFGGCSFCALTYHQGRQVRGRTKESILEEAKLLCTKEDFKGYIHDVGGPTANFRGPACTKQLKEGVCQSKDCLFPSPCKNLLTDHTEYLEILRAIRNLPEVKKVFIRSGIRYDFLLAGKNQQFIKELCEHHVSGILKVAPEHVCQGPLKAMRKPEIKIFEDFVSKYTNINKELGKKQYLIPYLMSSHPGTTLDDAIDLALYLKKYKFVPDQVQDFYPTPGTLSTTMYYTGINPLTGEKIYVPKTAKEKKLQRALIHFNKKENTKYVKEALKIAKRENQWGYFTGWGK